MHFIAGDQLRARNIARTQIEIAIPVIRHFHQQGGFLDLQLVERLAEHLGLHFFHVERVHHGELAVRKFRRQCRTQRPQQLLPGKGVIVGTRLRSLHRSAMTPQWRADRSNAGPAGTLLLPKLFAGTGNAPTVLRRMRASPLPGAVVPHRFPQQVFVHRAENFIGKIHGADLGAAQIVDINGCHFSSLNCSYWLLASSSLAIFAVADRVPNRGVVRLLPTTNDCVTPSWQPAWLPSTDRP